MVISEPYLYSYFPAPKSESAVPGRRLSPGYYVILKHPVGNERLRSSRRHDRAHDYYRYLLAWLSQ